MQRIIKMSKNKIMYTTEQYKLLIVVEFMIRVGQRRIYFRRDNLKL